MSNFDNNKLTQLNKELIDIANMICDVVSGSASDADKQKMIAPFIARQEALLKESKDLLSD